MMRRILNGLTVLLLCTQGCAITTGFYAEKDWMTDRDFVNPDFRTKAKIEITRQLDIP